MPEHMCVHTPMQKDKVVEEEISALSSAAIYSTSIHINTALPYPLESRSPFALFAGFCVHMAMHVILTWPSLGSIQCTSGMMSQIWQCICHRFVHSQWLEEFAEEPICCWVESRSFACWRHVLETNEEVLIGQTFRLQQRQNGDQLMQPSLLSVLSF